MASCIANIPTKNYQNLIIGFQVTVKNVSNGFFETQCNCILYLTFVVPAKIATNKYTLCLKKTSPTFSTVTCKPIIGF